MRERGGGGEEARERGGGGEEARERGGGEEEARERGGGEEEARERGGGGEEARERGGGEEEVRERGGGGEEARERGGGEEEAGERGGGEEEGKKRPGGSPLPTLPPPHSLFSPLLATLHWPQTGPPLPTQALDVWDNHSQQFSQLFGALMKMDDRVPPKSTAPQSPAPQSTAPTPQAEVGRWEDPLPLPLELMVKPLKKRFRYHFMEDRKTNSLEKVCVRMREKGEGRGEIDGLVRGFVVSVCHRTK